MAYEKRSYEKKDGSGVLFKNDHKESDKHPDMTGSILINSKEYRLAAWFKDGKKGKFITLAASDFKEGGRRPATGTSIFD